MERVSRLPSYIVFAQRQERLCRDLIREWNYTAAVQILEEMSRNGFVSNEKEFDRLLILCRGFAAWDKFDYQSAVEKISIYKEDPLIAGYNSTLKQICAALDWYEKWSPNSKKAPPVFVVVYDVLLNAERRACQGNYDDAVQNIQGGRDMDNYVFVQVRLVYDEDIDVSLLPEQFREHYEKKRASNGRIQVGLTDDYELLAILGHPVKQVWEGWRERILYILNKRNYSFLAHGMEPVSEKDYLEVKETVWSFISDCDQAISSKTG